MRRLSLILVSLVLVAAATAAGRKPTPADRRRKVREAEMKRLEKTLDLAGKLLSLERLDEARKLYREALTLRPDDSGIAASLLEVERRRGDDESQLPLFERLLAARPGDVTLHVAHGECLWRLGRTGEALAAWRALLARFPTDRKLPQQLYEVLLDVGRLDDAEGLLRRRRRRFGEDATLLRDEARLRLAREKPEDALLFLMRAVTFETDDDRLRRSVENVLFAVARRTRKTGDIEKYLRDQVIARDVEIAERLTTLAKDSAGRNDFAEAVELGEEALRSIPDQTARDTLTAKIKTWRKKTD